MTALAGLCVVTGSAFAQADKSGETPNVVEAKNGAAQAAPASTAKGVDTLYMSDGNGDRVAATGNFWLEARLRQKFSLGSGFESRGAAPANDECANAEAIPAGTLPVDINYDNQGSTDSAEAGGAACDQLGSTTFENDVWFTFDPADFGLVAGDSVSISTCHNADPDVDTKIGVYDSCGAVDAVACNDDGCGADFTSRLSFEVVDGQTYVIRVGGADGVGADEHAGTFRIEAGGSSGAGADECSDASEASGVGSFVWDNTDATTDSDQSSCGVNSDVWVEWEVPAGLATGSTITFNTDTTTFDTKMALWDGCPDGGGNELGCDDDGGAGLQSQIIVTHDDSITSYFVQLGSFSATLQGEGVLNVAVAEVGEACELSDFCVDRDNASNVISDETNFVAADNFQTISGGDLNEICWYGFYQQGQAADEFRITYYAENGDGTPGAQLASFTQGTDLTVTGPLLTGDTQTVGGTDFNVMSYSADHADVTLAAGDCVWVEIVNTSNDGWSWSGAGDSASIGDGRSLASADASYDATCDTFGVDLAFCVNVDLDSDPSDCYTLPGVAANESCDSAVAVTLAAGGFASEDGSTCGAAIPTCEAVSCGGGTDNDSPSMWYTVVGTGNSITVSTDGATWDTELDVFCGSCGAFTCVASDDDGGTGTSSEVTFCSEAGKTYYVQVHGDNADDFGEFTLTFNDDNTACDSSDQDCTRCEVVLDGNINEDESCGTEINDGCFNDTAPQFSSIAIGDKVNGSFWSEGGERDSDWYQFTLTEITDVTIAVSSERHALFGLVNTADCSAIDGTITFIGGGNTTADLNCAEVSATVRLNPGTYSALIAVNDFDSTCCSTGGADYTLSLSGSSIVACCFEGGEFIGPNGTDDCANATEITEGTFLPDTNGATEVGPLETVAGDCGAFGTGQIFGDIWYLYTASETGVVSATVCGATFDTRMAVYDAAGGCPDAAVNDASISCDDDGCDAGEGGEGGSGLASKLTFDAVAGNQYYIRVGTYSAAVRGSHFLTVTGPAAPAAGTAGGTGANWQDNCADALLETAVGEGVFAYDNTDATDGASSVNEPTVGACNLGGGSIYNDMWLLYTPSNDGQATFSTCGSSTSDLKMAIYDASACPTADDTALACDDDACDPGLQPVVSADVLAGETYLVRLGTYATGTALGAAELSIALLVDETPANDECADAIAVGEGNVSVGNTFANDGAAASCGDMFRTVWYAYTASDTGFANIDAGSVGFDARIAVYDACGGAEVACGDDEVDFIAQSGTTYWVAIAGQADDQNGAGNAVIALDVPTGCIEMGEDRCNLLGGSAVFGASCFEIPNPCEDLGGEGACIVCVPGMASDCSVMSEDDCTTAGGTYLGDGTTCDDAPAECVCDWDCNGTLNDDDFFAFLNGFFAGNADFDANGTTNDDDFFGFLNCFFSGC